MELFDWESRPAVVTDVSAFAILERGGAWETVNAAEVEESGKPVSPEVFSKMFPDASLPDLPAISSSASCGRPPAASPG